MKKILSLQCLREKQILTNISFITFKHKSLECLHCFHSGGRSENIITTGHTTGHPASFYPSVPCFKAQ